MRLRTVSCQDRGWRRVRHGRGFRYLDADGQPLAPEDVVRVKELVIPPAWRDVWICAHPNGHLQAVGTDEAGRRQYLYHPEWRVKRDLAKFDRVLELAVKLPGLRRKLRNQLRAEPGDELVERDRVLAAAVRMLDLGCFRPGSEASVDEFGSHGLTTLERQHVVRRGGGLVFAFVGKGGIEQEILLEDADVIEVVDRLRRRRSVDQHLLAVKVDRRWQPITPRDVNDRIRELTGLDVTAKDFRTWHATVTVAVALAEEPVGRSATARKRQVRAAVVRASELLGNTPTVARSSYVDPRVIDLHDAGTVLERVPGGQDAMDRAVARLLSN